MPIRNAHWADQNEGRAFPVDDSATCTSDAQVLLPPDLVCDLNLRWPLTLGAYAFLSAISSTPTLITVTIQAARTPESTGSFAPLAVISVPKPVAAGSVWALQGQVPGVGGWIVFGNGANTTLFQGRFSTPQQSLLAARAARAYRPLPVKSMQAQNANVALTGVVRLNATDPLQISAQARHLEGAYRDCIVVGLVDSANAGGYPVPAAITELSGYQEPSIFQQFAGPCGGRPESLTCGCPNPIQFINNVEPDCDGNITLILMGCAQATDINDPVYGGVGVACGLGLADACLPPQIPSSDGILPNSYTSANVPVPPPIPPSPPPPGVSDSYVPIEPLPYLVCFAIDVIPALTVVSGAWAVTANTDSASCPACEPGSDSGTPVSELWTEPGTYEFTVTDEMGATFTIGAHGAGGGGGGSSSSSKTGGGAAGGGGFGGGIYVLGPGDMFSAVVATGGTGGTTNNDGSSGGNSTITVNSVLLVRGGGGDGGNFEGGGVGGGSGFASSAFGGTSLAAYSGGRGGNGVQVGTGGSGGGGAADAGAGGPGVDGTSSPGAPAAGGAGGLSAIGLPGGAGGGVIAQSGIELNFAGQSGVAPGGGGAGMTWGGALPAGGNGANGQCWIRTPSHSSRCEPTGGYATETTATQNLAILPLGTSSAFRKVTTDCMLELGPPGAKHNAQLILNYRAEANTWFAVQVDFDTQTFELLYFNGIQYQVVVPASVVAPGVQLDAWYRIAAYTTNGPTPGQTVITMTLTSISSPGVTDIEIEATVSFYQPSDGYFGVGSNRALATFSYLKIESWEGG